MDYLPKEKRTKEYEAALKALNKLPESMRQCVYAESISEAVKMRWVEGKITEDLKAKIGDVKMLDLFQLVDKHFKVIKNGRKVLSYTAQPYMLDLDQIQKITEFCKIHNLHLHISAEKSWYYPGRTLLVKIEA